MFDLSNKVILITGASSGIGRESSILASKYGASIVLVGRNKVELEKTLSMLHHENNEHFVLPYDLTEIKDKNEFFDKISTLRIKIDGVVDSAGIAVTEPLKLASINSVDSVIDLNVKSPIFLVAGLLRNNLLNNNASIVLMSSSTAMQGEPGISIYSASKGAIVSLTKSLAAELVKKKKIRVNCLLPGHVKTNMMKSNFRHLSSDMLDEFEKKYPLGFGETSDVAAPVLFFLSDASKWITGSSLILDGGRSLMVG